MLVFLFFVCTTTLSYAQHMVSGVVKDVTGEPIIGANVVEKGTTNGSITDIDGKFSFSISKPVVTLSVSYIGYQPQDYAYKGQGSVIITLKEDLQNLDEVVVVGYGVAKKRDLTGSVASVKGEKLQETASLSALQAMQGRAAGVTIIQTSAKPGEEASIRVRGNRSLKATNEPLYVRRYSDCCRIKRIEPFGYRIGRGLERCFRNGHLRFAWSQWRDPGDN